MAASFRGSQLPLSLGPAAAELRDQLLDEISSGRLSPGQRLGAEREIAERFGISRTTVRAALDDLARSGAIRRARGRTGGIFVAERKVERDLDAVSRACPRTCAARDSSPTLG